MASSPPCWLVIGFLGSKTAAISFLGTAAFWIGLIA
ncbi:Uncharacterised protein [Vibrio cholerae]|nr:Uncharacterised protein [Vibrio cholerae]